MSASGDAVVNLWGTFATLCGYEVIGDQVRLHLDSPTPARSYTRERGERSPLFRLYAGDDARAILAWLDANKAWQCLRVAPPLTAERAVRAVLVADSWNGGEGSATYRLARDLMIAGEDHRWRLRRELRCLLSAVLENPVRPGEYEELQLLEDVANVAPAGQALATPAQVVDAYFGRPG